MEGIVFLFIGAFLFAVIGVIVLLVKTSSQGDLLREYGRRIGLLEEGLHPPGSVPEFAPGAAVEGPSLPVIEAGVPGTAEPPEDYPGAPWDEVQAPPPEVLEMPEQEEPPDREAAAGPRNPLTAFIRGGNLWAAGGIVLLLAGFATLITYLAGRGFFTVEMGIAGAALSGLIMLILGWGFRKKRPLYFLLLQGGGVGILYLSVFAAHKLTPFFSSPVSLILMTFLILPAVALALLQHSQALALLGFLGGFAAPLLIGGGNVNHVFLFAYYLVLDLGVLGIAVFRRWNILNLLALFYTLIFANLWALDSYRPELFWSAEPFFLAYIVIFTVLSLRSFEGESGRGFDAVLALGTPVLGAPLQWRVFGFFDHGHALISLAFAAFYIFLALVVGKRWKKGGKDRWIFSEAFLGFGVLLANLAAPLELAPRITSAVWAAEGLAVFLLGLGLEKTRIAAAALVLHTAAAAAFLFEQNPPFPGEVVFRSPQFAGSLVIALSALAMACVSRHPRFSSPRLRIPRPALSLTLGIWAFAWWFGGWFYEIYRGLSHPPEIFFLVCSATALGAYGASRLLRSSVFRLGIIPPFVYGVFIFLGFFIFQVHNYLRGEPWMILSRNYFTGLYLWAWLAFFAVQSLLIVLMRKELRKDLHGIWALIFIFISLEILSASGRALSLSYGLAPAWTSFAGLLPVFAAMMGISFLARRFPAPPSGEADRTGEGSGARLFFYILPLVLSCVLGLWFIVSLFLSGDPAPLPFYIPVINPLDLEEAFCIVLFLLWQSSLLKRGDLPAMKERTLFISIDAMIFLFTSALCARSVHFYGDIPYRRLIYSDVFHLCIFILWAVYGIGHVIAGNKLRLRRLWIAGAVLMVGDVAKFILLDLANAGTALRIVSFFVAGLLLLFIGWAAPLPPSAGERNGAAVPQGDEEA
jgi:uncharacterized membrane protein